MARLLLIDDDIAEISAVKRVLARSGRAPLLATNASDAQASIAQNRPDLLLVGVGCENGEALLMAHRLEEDEATRGIPLILLGTSDQAPAHAVQLPRPIDPAVLGAQVRALLGDGQATAPAMASTPIGRIATRQVKAQPRPAAPVLPALEPLGAPPPAAPASPPLVPPTTDLFPAARMTSVADASRPEPFERRSASAPLPGALERRAVPSDPANARRAAAEALRARASELRRPSDAAEAPAPAEAAAGLDALFGIQPPDGEEEPPAPIAETPFDLPLEAEPAPAAPPPTEPAAEEPGADEGASAGAWSADAWPADGQAATEVAVEVEAPAFDENALTAAARAAEEELARAREAEAEALRAREAELQAGQDVEAREDADRQAWDEAARAREAEARAIEEAEARRALEDDLQRLRDQLEEERRASQDRLRSALDRAAAEEAAALEQRAQAEAEARRAEAEARRVEVEARQAELQAAAEEAGRRAAAEAQARAAEELQQLRAQVELEGARRAEAEAALARAAETASQLAAAREALARVAPAPSPPAEPEPAPASLGEPPPQDEAQEAARRRALSLRQRPAEVSAQRLPFAWPEPPPEPTGAAEPEPEPEPPPPAPPPAELRSGNLEDLPAPRLLALAARVRMGGRLDVQGDAARSLWFEEGRVVGAASNAPGERIEEVSLRLGLLTREQHRQVAGTAASLATRRAALLLLERGYVKPAELTALVRRRTDEVVFGVFGETGARFRWAPEAVPSDERIAPDRPPLALAVEGVRRRWLAPRTDAVLGGPATLVTPVHGAPTAAELGLSAEERRALALADGLRTLDELVSASPLDPLSTRQLLAALVLTGALTVRVVQAGRPAAQVAAAIDLARVKEKHEQARRADYFTILGIGRVGTPHEAREAADRLLAEFDPRKLAGAGDEALAARLEEIRRVVSDAREVLADDALRAEYLRGLGP